MAVSANSASWEIPDDRIASAVWLGIIWLGIVVGFGVDIPTFLREKPAAAGIIYVHAAVFVSWLSLVTAQVAFVLRGRMDQHRRLGSKAGYIAVLMVLLGLATGKYRNRPAAHKRLMMLAMISVAADPGFARSMEYLSPPLTSPLNFFVSIFWANVLLVVAMFGWDLWRHGRVHRALLIGGVSLLGAEVATAFVFFNPTWNTLATGIVHAWGYTGGMP